MYLLGFVPQRQPTVTPAWVGVELFSESALTCETQQPYCDLLLSFASGIISPSPFNSLPYGKVLRGVCQLS